MIHNDKKVPLNLYEQIIDDHIIFTNVVSNKNTDFQFYIFLGLNLIIILCFKEMRNILGYEKKKNEKKFIHCNNNNWGKKKNIFLKKK
jgi:hypothetical protein